MNDAGIAQHAPPSPAPRKRLARKEAHVRLIGKLVRIKKAEGYGFIHCDETGIDYYVNIGSLRHRAAWREGVEFSFIPGKQQHPKKAPPAVDPLPVPLPETTGGVHA